MRCQWCGRALVQVDNPFRREIRHRRGEEVLCPGPPEPTTTAPSAPNPRT
jgi:hypothetical protein